MRSKTMMALAASALMGLGACGDAADDSGSLEECTPENADVLDNNVEGEDITLSQCTLVTERITVFDDGHVTVEPGSTIFFAERAGFWMQEGTSFNAAGTADEPILMTGVEQRAGFWQSLDFEGAAGSDNVLEHVTIEYAGYDDVAALKMRNGTTISVRNSTIRHSSSAGFMFPREKNVEVLAFEHNTITSNAEAGIAGTINAGFIAANNDLTGNESDWVRVDASSGASFTESMTYRDIGVPYLLVQGISVGNDAVWTIEPGVEILVAGNQRIWIDNDGTIVAKGTADAPIVIRGKESTPGYWLDLLLRVTPSPNNALEHVVISDAGGGGESESAAVRLESGRDKTMRVALDQVTIRDSAGHGFYGSSGYEGMFEVSGCDTVVFEGIAGQEFAGDPFCN